MAAKAKIVMLAHFRSREENLIAAFVYTVRLHLSRSRSKEMNNTPVFTASNMSNFFLSS